MPNRYQDIEKIRRPELFLSELLNKSSRGELYDKEFNVNVIKRALVVAVDVEGGKLENPSGQGTITHEIDGNRFSVNASVGLKNPPNSIKARLISNAEDQFISDEDLRIFWPMMPNNDMIPIKPGEHAFVIFEDENFEHGLWLGKVSGHDNVNFFEGSKSFKNIGRDNIADIFGDSQENDDGSDRNSTESATQRFNNSRLAELF